MKEEAIRQLVLNSLDLLAAEDSYLIDQSVSERSICHRLALHLSAEELCHHWHIDCEFNRNGEIPKSMELAGQRSRVFPDIIMHQRGPQGSNLLVIEVKVGVKSKRDEAKIESYIREFGYRFGLFLIIPKNSELPFRFKWFSKESLEKIRTGAGPKWEDYFPKLQAVSKSRRKS